MKRISCGAHSCAYNFSGSCGAGNVQVEEAFFGEKGPYCETFSRAPDAALLPKMPFPKDSLLPEGGPVSCAMLRCIHNACGACGADPLIMESPRHRETPFIPCGSYCRK